MRHVSRKFSQYGSRFRNIRRFASTLLPNKDAKNVNSSRKLTQQQQPTGQISKIVSSYLQQWSQEPRTNRPSHYNEEAQNDPKNPWRKRAPAEYAPKEEAPYQHSYYNPPNDKSTELYNNFRDSGHTNGAVALREGPRRRFIPGAANPYLRSFGRYYSNHYQRLAAESETGQITSMYIAWLLVASAPIIYFSPALALYTGPEYGGLFLWV